MKLNYSNKKAEDSFIHVDNDGVDDDDDEILEFQDEEVIVSSRLSTLKIKKAGQMSSKSSEFQWKSLIKEWKTLQWNNLLLISV